MLKGGAAVEVDGSGITPVQLADVQL